MLVDFRDFIGVIGMGAKPLSGEWSSAHARAIFLFFSLFSRGHHSIFPAIFSCAFLVFPCFSSHGIGVWTRSRELWYDGEALVLEEDYCVWASGSELC